MAQKIRCPWCMKDDLYMDYHDTIWAIPEYEEHKLFEFLNLEGAQAGLSWYSILSRMENYKKAFKGWDPNKIVSMSGSTIERLMHNPGIIRNRLKIKAVIGNAEAYLNMKEAGLDFSEYIWSFVDGKTIVNEFSNMSQIPAQTDLSRKMSKDLKQRGFKFVGPTIVYAFMQAVGMVDDHLVTCWKRQ